MAGWGHTERLAFPLLIVKDTAMRKPPQNLSNERKKKKKEKQHLLLHDQ